ncbi:MAG: hypothetical protein ACE5KM_03070 [Planctomycetaceae bacterium]
MKKDDLVAFRDRELSEYYAELMDSPGRLRSESAPIPPKTSQRIAIGGRRRGGNNYDLVIRVQNVAGRAITRAREITERVREQFGAKQVIDFAVMKRVSAPSRRAVAQAGGRSGFGAKRVRPLSIGYSVGHRDGAPGTIGLFAKAADGIAVVSCNHVLALTNEARPKDWIYQASPPDLAADTQHRIGRLAHFRELSTVGANLIDAAYCVLEEQNEDEKLEPTENVIPLDAKSPDSGKSLRSVIDPFDMDPKNPVAKIGKASGYTSEPVENVAIGINDVTVEFPGYGNHRFDNMIEVEWSDGRRPFARPGDSGSVLYQEKSLAAFGLHVASGEITRGRGGSKKTTKVSYACPLQTVLDIYNLALL